MGSIYYLVQNLIKNFFTKSFFIFFGIGLLAASLDYFLYIQFLGHGFPMMVAKLSSSALAVILNYLLNSQFNFGGKHKIDLEHMIVYGMLYSVLIFIHALFNQGFYLLLQNVHLAVLGALGISTIINFLTVKKFFSYYNNN